MRIKLLGPVALLAMAILTGAGPALAEEESVTVRLYAPDLHPRTPAAADRLLGRIEEAALEACGASPSSLYELRRAARQSDCWRKAVSNAVAQVGDPELSRALERQHPDWR